jgi:twitching motility two-component system response regulator PilH
MPGESIMIVDDSTAVQDIAQATLHRAGYNVTTASNGVAALTHPGIESIDLIIIDKGLAGFTGDDTTHALKTQSGTHPIPVLMLVPEEFLTDRTSCELGGAAGYLVKPFDAPMLVRKVQQILEQCHLDDIARQYLNDAAEKIMIELADKQIGVAVDKKTELIVQRSIQKVTAAVDQAARKEVEDRVTTLVTEKEQELVKLTVNEVANSMVEKLALTKVEEAMHSILKDETEKAVRRQADQFLPNQIREKTKEMLANLLPREVETRLQRAAEKMVPELSQQIIGTVEAVAGKAVPRTAREMLPPVVEAQVATVLNQTLPRKVQELVAHELSEQMARRIEPAIKDAHARLRRQVMLWGGLVSSILVVGVGLGVWFFLQALK